MSFTDLARSASDGDLQQRLIAAAAAAQHPNPQTLVLSKIWQIVSDAAISDAYSYACGNRVDRPGFYPDIISDQVIADVIGPIVLADLAPVTPTPNPEPEGSI